MKIKELASELSLTGKEVLEKAKTMGIEVSGINDELSDIDTTAKVFILSYVSIILLLSIIIPPLLSRYIRNNVFYSLKNPYYFIIYTTILQVAGNIK